MLTNKRFVLLAPASRGADWVPVIDRPIQGVELVQVRRARLMVQLRLNVGPEAWVLEFLPRDRAVATDVVDTLDGFVPPSADEVLPPPQPAPAAPEPAPPAEGFGGYTGPAAVPTLETGVAPLGAPGAPAPALAPNAPRPEMLLTVLAMGDPSAVPALAAAVQGAFPPPPDPLPKVDRISVRNVANQLRDGRCTTTEAQRWAAVVQRALRLPEPPVVLDPFDPFPDQLAAGILVLLKLDATSDPRQAADAVAAAMDAGA